MQAATYEEVTRYASTNELRYTGSLPWRQIARFSGLIITTAASCTLLGLHVNEWRYVYRTHLYNLITDAANARSDLGLTQLLKIETPADPSTLMSTGPMTNYQRESSNIRQRRNLSYK